ncbi:MAG: transglutaminase family protein [Deltaproteobacteria bacterium]|nr:transglutaminase family protein [Deltaproteobacteria bacterium]
MKKIILFFLFLLFSCEQKAHSSTLVLEGRMDGAVGITQERSFSVPKAGLKRLVFRFAVPADFNGRTVSQNIAGHAVEYYPKPDSVKIEKDRFGNSFTAVTWLDLTEDAKVRETYKALIGIDLKGVKSVAPFPLDLKEIPESERRFLPETPLVQFESPEVRPIAHSLSKGLTSEQEVVMSVLNWVVDNIKYKTPVEDYSALWTLKTGQGNCQNFSHLSIALLRSLGIPARIVGGVSLGKSWKVPLKDGALLQSIGQGGHAWLEVWYPDLGWVPYDAQQSHLFVGPRHIKQTVGLDSMDINDSWRASPVLPPFKEEIAADYLKDDIELSLKEARPGPVSYIMTSSIFTGAKVMPVPPKRPEEPKPPAKEITEFGNTEFPSLMDFYIKSKEDVGRKTFDKETAEYVTGAHTFAQAFTIPRSLKIDAVSLAMHKFGGRAGSLWIDVVKDDRGRPGMEGLRSLPLLLDTVPYYPGYKWLGFGFGDEPALPPGKYWIILRHSRDAVVNWFYTPGNAYGGPDDARSTEAGIDWSNIMNYDFNFSVKGAFLAAGD